MRNLILITDDDSFNRLYLSIILDDDYNCIEAENGQVAIDLLSEKNSIDLMLLDLRMPIKNGYDVIDYIRNTLKSDLPIIVVSSEPKHFISGIDGYIEKPVNKPMLLKMIENLLKD